jgi:hypothetical protein
MCLSTEKVQLVKVTVAHNTKSELEDAQCTQRRYHQVVVQYLSMAKDLPEWAIR